MVTAIRQCVTIGPGGVVEVSSPELPPGARAEVIVLVEKPGDSIADASKTEVAARLDLLDKIQRELNLTPESAAAWMRQTREEREASSDRLSHRNS